MKNRGKSMKLKINNEVFELKELLILEKFV